MIPMLYDCFKHWAEKGSIFVFSDTHFNDLDCKLMDENWISPEEQIKILNKDLQRGWNTLILLGDVGDLSYVKQLKAKHKVLIKGNHDDKAKELYHEVFDEIFEGPIFIAEKILLSHEPIDGLDFCMNIHGHDHSGIYRKNHLNVAANVHNYRAINLGNEIKKGLLSNINTIHRETINKAVVRKKECKKK